MPPKDKESKLLHAQIQNVLHQLSGFNEYISHFKDSEIIESDKIQINLRINSVEPYFNNFNDYSSKLTSLSKPLDDELVAEFTELYFSTLTKAKGIISAFDKVNALKVAAEALPQNLNLSPMNVNNASESTVRLPKLEIPIFTGDYVNWTTFKDSFTSMVHNKPKIANIDKFQFLKNSLRDKALSVIDNITLTDQNYLVAWNLLCDRFDNKRLLVHSHIKSIIDLPMMSKESHVVLRQIYDNLTKHMRALSNLQIPVSQWDDILIFIVHEKFDNATKRAFAEFKYANELPTIDELNKFLKKQCDMLERLSTPKPVQPVTSQTKPKANSSSFKQQSYISTNYSCPSCKGEHSLYQCDKFQTSSVNDRFNLVKGQNLCRNCFSSKHNTAQCSSKYRCKYCNKSHHTLLHFETNSSQAKSQSDNTTKEDTSNRITISNLSKGSTSQILLSTALVRIRDNKGKFHSARCLLDSGSQSNFITRSLCEKLKLTTSWTDYAVRGIDNALSHINRKTVVNVSARHNNFTAELSCLVLPKITENIPIRSFAKNDIPIPDEVILADPNFNHSKQIDILIGVSHFYQLLCVGQISVPSHGNILLQKTKLGYVLSGEVSTTSQPQDALAHCNVMDLKLHNQVSQFWALENIPSNGPYLSTQEEECERHFQENVQRDVSGRFIVSMPFKESPSNLGESKQSAFQRFLTMEKKLQLSPTLKQEYVKFMQEYEDLQHMTKIELNLDESQDSYFIPHHGVIKESSLTTKLRVVFDASMKTTSGVSLNDLQMIGPTLQSDLFSILLRFRQHSIVLSGDIMKMYRQVLINPEQRALQRILWRKDPQDEISCYELNTVTYGTSSAPYLATKCLMHLADLHKAQFPEASHVLATSFYVDDLLTGGESVEEVKQLQQELATILSGAGFDLRKYLSNNPQVLTHLEQNENIEHCVLSIGDSDQSTRTLGVIWNSNSDTIQYSINLKEVPTKTTKRIILSTVSQVYDPLGLINPVIVSVKMIIQELWQLGVSWDESIPQDLHTKWNQLRSQLHTLNQLKIPRQVRTKDSTHIQLHGFSDASEKAYGACVFVRSTSENGNSETHLLCAKSRVAPIRNTTTTLPKLELCAAMLLAQLLQKAMDSLTFRISDVYYWSDSTIALCWIKTCPSKLKTFVANRVAAIQRLTNIENWHHVKSEDNPADIVSRGATPVDLLNSTLWWNGPAWLSLEQSTWPLLEQNQTLEVAELPETRHQTVINIATADVNNSDSTILSRYSSYNKLVRIVAHCFRFKSNALNPKVKITGPLTIEELENARIHLIKIAQSDVFDSELKALNNYKSVHTKSQIRMLDPILDASGIIRVGGRLQNSNYDLQKKHPIILPQNHRLTYIIMRSEHLRLFHCGVQHLLASLRERFWPLGAKRMAKRIIFECVTCFKVNPRKSSQLMGQLPAGRVNITSPFHEVGVDYAGPLLLKDRFTRNAKLIKCYVCLFICYATKAIHLDLVTSLSTEAFLACLKRFIARRGKPQTINSDNGSNFVGASRELATFLGDKQNQQTITNFLSEQSIVWKFIPPRSPNFGGLWEAGIKSTKFHLKRMMGNASLNFEELSTILCQIEAILNSRPLSPMSNDPNDLTPLTPAHFIVGKSLTSLPEPDLVQLNESRLSKYQRLQKLIQTFWSRWAKEYVSELQTRLKWKQRHPDLLKEGALVLLSDENRPPLQWQMGRVIQLHPGPDDVVRVVTIKLPNSVTKRAISKICVLPID